jgi:hypothetical protein
MNKYLSILLIIPFLFSCELTDQRREEDINSDMIQVPVSSEGMTDAEMPKFEFESDVFEFGTISQGEKVSFSFRFKNIGDADLIINKVEGSCGCTVMKGWPKHPVKPGDFGKIDVIFDSNGKRGIQNKTISVVANTYPSTTVLTLKGEIASPI